MASTVTRFQPNRAPLGCSETGAWRHGCAADKMDDVNMEQNLWGMLTETC